MKITPFLFTFVLAHFAGPIQAEDANAGPSVADGSIALSRIVVTEQRTQEGAARIEQQRAPNIINVMTSTDIMRLPEVNAAEALRRVPGISLWSDTGEGRFVAIRGLDSDLNSTTFNGVRLLPTNPATIFGGGRAVALDVIPAGMIGSMVVTKTNKPEQDAEALGGTVDISPKVIPSNQTSFAEFRAGSGYEPLRRSWIVDLSATAGIRFGGDSPHSPSAVMNPSNQPFSFVGTASQYNDSRGIDDVEPGLINANATDRSLAGFDQRYYTYHRQRHAFGGELSYRPDNRNRYALSLFDSGYKESKLDNILTINFDGNATTYDNQVFQDTISDGAYQKALVNHIEKLSEQTLIFSGENEIGDLLLDYKLAHVTGKYDVSKDVTTTFNSVGSGAVTYDNSGDYPRIVAETGPDKTNPANYVFGNYRSAVPHNKTTEDTIAANLSVPLPAPNGPGGRVKFGASLRDKHYHADTDYFSGPANAGVGSPSLAGFSEGPDVNFYHNHYQNGPNLSPTLTDSLVAQGGLTQSAGNIVRTLNAHARDQEKISAAYFQYSVDLGQWGILAGLRLENTKGTYAGNLVTDDQFIGPVSRSKTYTDYFPAISLKYQLTEKWVLRASRSSTIARPGFNQLNANTQVDTSGNSVTAGNTRLNPTKASSYDLDVERYFGNSGIVSIGLFQKDLKDYIVSDIAFLDKTNALVSGYGFTGSSPIKYQSYANTHKAYAEGAEVAFEQRFRSLPGLLSGFGVIGNYTYVKSRFDLRPGESHALPSTAKNTYNAVLFYESKGASVRLGLSHVDKYLSGIGPDATQDVYTDPINWLDVGFQYQITPALALYFNVKNLLDAPVRYTQGTTGRTIQREFYGQTYQAGVTAKF
jgi:TonB-dependent receptor